MTEKDNVTRIDENEFAVAKKESENTAGVYVHEFSTPFSYEGKTYEKLTFDWNKLTGEDSLAIENELQSLGKAVIMPEFSGDYLVRMASRACTDNIGADVILAMSLGDYNAIRGKARSFLLRLGR